MNQYFQKLSCSYLQSGRNEASPQLESRVAERTFLDRDCAASFPFSTSRQPSPHLPSSSCFLPDVGIPINHCRDSSFFQFVPNSVNFTKSHQPASLAPWPCFLEARPLPQAIPQAIFRKMLPSSLLPKTAYQMLRSRQQATSSR